MLINIYVCMCIKCMYIKYNNILIIIAIKNWRSDCTPSGRDCEN